MDRDQFLWDIFVTAIEGGISYWAYIRSYHHSTNGVEDHEGFIAHITDTETDKHYEITRATILRGLKLFRTPCELQINACLRREIMVADITNGENTILDANGADAVIQAGLFGDVLYG